MTLDETSVLVPTDVLWRDVGGEVVLLDQGGKRLLGLNSTGGLVWRLLDGHRTLAEVAAELERTANLRAVTLRADVLAFGRLLVERRFARLVA